MIRILSAFLAAFIFSIAIGTTVPDSVYAYDREEESEDFMPLVTPEEDESKAALSQRCETLAKLLGVRNLVDELFLELKKSKPKEASQGHHHSNKSIFIRLQLADFIQYGSLQTQDALTKIDLNIVDTNKQRILLDERRNKSAQVKNIATFMTTGALSILSSSLGFGNTNPSTTRILGTLSGSSSTVIPTANFFHRRVESYLLTATGPNMLAQVFDRKPGKYNEINSFVWSYLNSLPPGSKRKLTRLERLKNSWKSGRGISHSLPSSEREIDFIVGIGSGRIRSDANLLAIRSDLLTDLRAEVSKLYSDLAELKSSIIGL